MMACVQSSINFLSYVVNVFLFLFFGFYEGDSTSINIVLFEL